ncbi:MAG TPA: glycoside hydrolase family 44 protein [Opitutaceae bacterium]|nr:glycoside hydrolase family 44 protein [Opitutaceae bacterium]
MNTTPGASRRATSFTALFTAVLALACFAAPAAAADEYVYQSGLVGPWRTADWGATVNLDGSAAGHASATKAIEVTATGSWQGVSLADVGDSWNPHYHELSTVTAVEFDVLAEADSTEFENVVFMLDGSEKVTRPPLVNYIPGWSSMTTAERYGHWFHVSIDLAALNPTFTSFYQIVFFKMSASGAPHFRIAEVKLVSTPDTTPPSVTVTTSEVDTNQLTLVFTTSEAATYRVEYGYGSYSQTLTGPATAATSHTASLTDLTVGATLQYRIVATDLAGNTGDATGSVAITEPTPPTTATVTITADPVNTHAISPWIYGGNFYQDYAGVLRNLTVNRLGGNRWTAYNWENNASNAGADWHYQSDAYLGGGDTAGEAIRPVLVDNRTRGTASIFTVQMQGYVAADKNGDNVMTAVPDRATRLATRFKQVVYSKPNSAGAFTTTPPTADAYVYMDEFAWAMNQKIPGLYSDPVNPTFLILDNEPELWGGTHAEIQDGLITPADYLAKIVALSTALKNVAPDAKLFGPVHYGFNGLYGWQDSSGYSSSYWFTDHFLTAMKNASDTAGRRLLDVYNFHWYSEATDGSTRITELTGPTLTDAQVQAIVQSPRSLWDPTYTENSWITQWRTSGPIRLLPRLKEKIAAHWPGTELAITEWGNGGFKHIAGAIAVADNLGIFGEYDLFEATYWPLSTITADSFDGAGFKMYRDFDGALSSFGDICLPATSSDTAKVSAYVSRDSIVDGRYVIVAINRSNTAQAASFAGLSLTAKARSFRLRGTSTTPVALGAATVDTDSWILALPAYSITTVELTEAAANGTFAAWRTANFSTTDLGNNAVSGPDADPDGTGVTNFARYAFGLPARGPVAAPTMLGTTASGGSSYLTLTFTRRATASDIAYTVEASSDLVNWSTVTTFTPGTPAQVTAQDSVALGTKGVTRRFLRVRVAAP